MFALTMAVGLAIAFYGYAMDKHFLMYYGDAISHSIIARKVIDWADPGLMQLGTGWLPLQHLVLVPFVAIDSLFFSGFAGAAVSLPSLGITSALFYKIIREHYFKRDGFRYVAIAIALLYALNPNILYVGITAMTEALFMLFFVASAYYFQKWYFMNSNHRTNNSLLYSAIFVSLATLCRYEAWFLPLLLISVVIAVTSKSKGRFSNRTITILISIVSLSGVAAWLTHNEYQYGNILEFSNAQYYSAAWQASVGPFRDSLFLNPVNVSSIYGQMALAMYGPILIATSIAGIFVLARRIELHKLPFHIFLVLPPIFTITSMLIGIGEMGQESYSWFNSRFLILLFPILIVLTSVLVKCMLDKIYGNRTVVLVGIIGALFVSLLYLSTFGTIVTLTEAKNGFSKGIAPYAVQTGKKLGSIYDDGTIMMLTGGLQEHRIMINSWIPLRQFDEMVENSMWKESFYEPWSFDKWIVISKMPDLDGIKTAKYWEEKRAEIDNHYKKVYENEYYEILVLK
jgi:hypothetical protein